MTAIEQDRILNKINQMVEEFRTGLVKRLEQVVEETASAARTPVVEEAIVPAQPVTPTKSTRHREKAGKPLYEAAYDALVQVGGKGRANEITAALKASTKRKDITSILTYQALEYNRKHKNNVTRNSGVWEVTKQSQASRSEHVSH